MLADGVSIGGVSGWTTSNITSIGTYKPTTAQFTNEAPDGLNTAFENNDTTGTIAQVLTATLQPNTIYKLQVEVGARLDYPFAAYDVQLVAGSVVKASNNTVVPVAGSFSTVTVSFSAANNDPQLGQPLEIRLVIVGGTPPGQVNFDNVRLVAIPEGVAPVASQNSILALVAALALLGARKVRGKLV